MCDLSVILSTRNRERLLDQTLGALAAQKAGALKWEVVVVDNGSTDATPDVLARWARLMPLAMLHEPTPGKNRALNRALGVAAGEMLVFTDDDVIPDARWLLELHEGALRWPDDGVFGGMIVPRFPVETPEFLRAVDFKYAELAYCRYIPQPAEGPVSLEPYGPNMMIRRSLLGTLKYAEQIGPTLGSYSTGSETEFLSRLHDAGHRFIYLPGAVVEHVILPHQLELGWLIDRAFRFGRAGAWLGPKWDGPRLLSAPRYLWRRFFSAGMSLGASCIGGRGKRWEALMGLGHVLGMIHEHRKRSQLHA